VRGKGPAGGRENRLRPLSSARALQVRVNAEGHPTFVVRSGGSRRVEAIRESWRIDDEWWREPIRRWYAEVVLEDGKSLTLYHDLVKDRWFEQGGG
jgi:hypothetical protein